MSHPTYIYSSTSISEPIKPFDGLDHNYTPEEYLQHIEARVTFSLGLQPTSEHEYKYTKNPKDFANKRQVKHTFTVLEPSISFHTLVKLVDAEDIANDKIRTHDLALEINNITKQLNTQTLDHSSQEQLMYTQPEDPNNKKNLHKKYCSYCHRTNHSISACFKKQRDDEDKREAYARSKSPQKSFVQYFVLLPMTEQNTMIIDTEVEVPHETTLTTKIIHKTDTVLHLEIEIDFVMTKVLLLHTTLDQDMIHTNVILGLTVLLTDLLIDPHIDKTLVLDTDHAPIQEITNSPSTQNHIDHLQDQEILDFLDLAHTQIPEIKSI